MRRAGGSWTQARREDIRAFLSQLFANGVKDRSVARKLSTLRHFYKYLLLDRIIKQDPTLEIDSPKQWKVLPKSLAASEIDSMMEAAGQAGDSKISAALAQRDQTMLEVFYAGGMRVSEIINVKLEDLKLELGYILVRGKERGRSCLIKSRRRTRVILAEQVPQSRKFHPCFRRHRSRAGGNGYGRWCG